MREVQRRGCRQRGIDRQIDSYSTVCHVSVSVFLSCKGVLSSELYSVSRFSITVGLPCKLTVFLSSLLWGLAWCNGCGVGSLAYAVPSLASPGTALHFALSAAGVFFLFCIYFNYLFAVFTPPGSPPLPTEQEEKDQEEEAQAQQRGGGGREDSATEGYRSCKKCSAKKPPRCHHCSQCGSCTLKFDHHCVRKCSSLPVFQSVCLSACLSACLYSLCLSICLSLLCLCVCVSLPRAATLTLGYLVLDILLVLTRLINHVLCH